MLTGGDNAATIRILSQADIASILTPQQVIERVEEAYTWKAQGKTSTFRLVFHEFEPGVADMDIKSGHLQPAGLFGLKLVSFFENNGKIGLPYLFGLIMLADDSTGKPRALMEGTHLTGLRTGAAAAIGAKHLARPQSETFLMIGTGHQCTFQVGAMLSAFPNIKKVFLYDPRNVDKARSRALSIREDTRATLGIKLPENTVFEAVEDIELAVSSSDIITTATPAREPLIFDSWVQPGTHINCIGSDMSGKQEIDPHILARARIFVDDLPQTLEVGEIELAVQSHIIKKEDVIAEIGEVLAGMALGRTSEKDITVFDSTGIALQDLAAAKAALDVAEAQNVGCIAPL